MRDGCYPPKKRCAKNVHPSHNRTIPECCLAASHRSQRPSSPPVPPAPVAPAPVSRVFHTPMSRQPRRQRESQQERLQAAQRELVQRVRDDNWEAICAATVTAWRWPRGCCLRSPCPVVPSRPVGRSPLLRTMQWAHNGSATQGTAADLFPFRKTVTGGLRKPVNHSFTGAGNQASTERWKGVLFPLPQFPLPIPNSPSSTSCGVSGGSPLKGCLVQAVCF